METRSKAEKLTSGAHLSLWLDEQPSLEFIPLSGNIKNMDAVIIGGGISGLTVAYCLLQAGKKVVVLEDGNIGSGETGRTTAHLTNALDDRYYHLRELFGDEEMKLIAKSHTDAISLIEKIVKDEQIDCDFTRLDGYLFLDPTDKKESLDKELEALRVAGVEASMREGVPGMNGEGGPCLVFPDQAQFHPMKYLKGLCKAIRNKGGEIYTSTRVESISDTGVKVRTGFHVEAKNIVVAANSPFNNFMVIHTKQYPYRTYVIGARIKKDTVRKALWWDTGNQESSSSFAPYHYVRTQEFDTMYDMLICGGEDHATGLAEAEHLPEEERYKRLESWLRARFDIEDVVYRWSGQVLEPMDSLAFIGRNPMDLDNVFVVTGDSGNGMTHGTLAGPLITDLIMGKENSLEKIYDPSRIKWFGAGGVFFKEFVGGFITYLKNLPNTNPAQIDKLAVDHGMVLDWHDHKCGVYRDHENTLHVVDAKCTHMGCTIKWNNDEKTWDCPCHGSRFSKDGKVMNGPANTNLHYHKEKWGG